MPKQTTLMYYCELTTKVYIKETKNIKYVTHVHHLINSQTINTLELLCTVKCLQTISFSSKDITFKPIEKYRMSKEISLHRPLA